MKGLIAVAALFATAVGFGWGWGGQWRATPRQSGGGGSPVSPPGQVASVQAELDALDAELTWSAVPGAERYWVHRGFGGEKTTIAEVYTTSYTDAATVAGAPHYYQVTAVNSGGPGTSSSEVSLWPKEVKTFRTPFYYLGQWRDYNDAAPLTQAEIDSLAQFDAIGVSPHYFEGPHERAYEDYVARVREAADELDGHEVIFLTYLFGNAARLDWGTQATYHPGTDATWGPYPAQYDRGFNAKTRIWDWCVANDGFLHDTNGDPVFNTVYPVYNYDYGNLELAEKVAEFFVDSLEGSDLDGEYCGFLYDFANTDIQDWTMDINAVDLDRDGNAYNSSPAERTQEIALYRDWHLHCLKSLRKEFGERGMANRLIVVNGNGTQNLDDLAEYVDGWMEERWNDGTNGWPGLYTRFASAAEHRAAWDGVLQDYADPDRFPNSQVRPYPFMFHMYVSDSAPWNSLLPALAANGWAHGNSPSLNAGCGSSDACYSKGANGEARMSIAPTRLNVGTVGQYTLLPSSNWPSQSDTLRVPTSTFVARMALRPSSGQKSAWPYIIISTAGDTLARGGGWPRKALPVGPAPVAAFSGTPLSGTVPLTVAFTDASTNTPTEWFWQFGDTEWSTSQNPSHEYDSAGTYTVTLTASNAGGYDDEVKTNYVTVTEPAPEGSPEIATFSGTDDIIEDQVFYTLTGTDFGTVASPQMVVFDDLESGSQSAVWEDEGANNVPVITATSDLRRHAGSTKHGRHQFTGDRSISDSYATYRDGLASRTFFGGYWFRLADDWQWGAGGVSGDGQVGSSLANVKFVRLSTAGSVDDWTIAVHPYSGSGIWATAVSVTCNSSVTSESGYCCGEWSDWDDSTWHHVQFEWVDSSTAGAADARFKVWVDGQVIESATNFIGMKCAAGGYKRIFGLGFYDSWWDSSSDPNQSTPYNFYIDDIYYDTQLARVELGDASTYSACSHREVQLSSTWSGTEIYFESRIGSFAPGTLYLFVIDGNGTPSAGYPVYLE